MEKDGKELSPFKKITKTKSAFYKNLGNFR